MLTTDIKVGLLGLGVIGGQVARVLIDKEQELCRLAGGCIKLHRIKVLPADLEKPLARTLPHELFTTNNDSFFDDESIEIVIELIGGEEPAFSYIKQALEKGKHVVTANKEVVAKHGPELKEIARRKGVSLYYEASVGGGIPLIAVLEHELKANYIKSIHAIINGTTNYILTRMSQDGIDFNSALKQAQELGYAEANPANDIESIDAAYKLAIMSTLAFQCRLRPDEVYHEGISRLEARDFKYARELGYALKLLAIARQSDSSVEARVHPALIKADAPLASINGVFNAVSIEGDLVGRVILSGQGAGPLPTSSAVIADVLRAVRDLQSGSNCRAMSANADKSIRKINEITTRFYMRLTILDSSGVLASIARILGEHSISISSVIQKETDTLSKTAEIVIMTHPALGNSVVSALDELGRLEAVKEINNVIRVEEQ